MRLSVRDQPADWPAGQLRSFENLREMCATEKDKRKSCSEELISQTHLPRKKGCSDKLDDKKLYISKVEENSNIRKMKEDTKKYLKVRKDLKIQERKVKIMPGVIRHTSCPNSYLAFYFNYD